MSAAAAALLAEASAAGVRLRLDGEDKVKAAGGVPPGLLARLRERKAELATLLRGDACCHCGGAMGWPDPVGVVFAEGTAAHHACDERAKPERARARTGDAARIEPMAGPTGATIRRETP